jgi:hypothetical protein
MHEAADFQSDSMSAHARESVEKSRHNSWHRPNGTNGNSRAKRTDGTERMSGAEPPPPEEAKGGAADLLGQHQIHDPFQIERGITVRKAIILALPNCFFLTLRYLRKHKRVPNLIRPTSFTEKILCKMSFDRNEFLPIISDKLAVRDFVRERVGPEVLTKIYAVYDSESEIQIKNLPDRFVLKANHGWHFNYFVNSALDKNEAIFVPLCRKWLTTNYGRSNAEWAYQSIRPKIFAEEYLDAEGIGLVEYKIFCFDGEPRFLKVILRRLSGVKSKFFDLDWNPLEVAEASPNFPCDMVSRPENLEEMFEVSKLLSHGFDFLRVDLYNLHNKIVFGELTNYHNAGLARFFPPEYDYKFGSYWDRHSMVYLPIK